MLLYDCTYCLHLDWTGIIVLFGRENYSVEGKTLSLKQDIFRSFSIVQGSSLVVNFTSSVELIPAMAYKLKRVTIQNSKKVTYNFKKRETLNKTCASTTLNTRKKIVINSYND